MPFGYNPVLRAQENLARTLSGGLSNLANRDLEKAKFGLLEKQTLADIARNQRADIRAEQALDLQREQFELRKKESEWEKGFKDKQEQRLADAAARNQWIFEHGKDVVLLAESQAKDAMSQFKIMQGYRKQPITATGAMSLALGPNLENHSREKIGMLISEGLHDEIAKATGTKIVQENGKTYFVRPDGSKATFENAPAFMPIMSDLIYAAIDPVRATEQRIREWDKVGIENLSDEEKVAYQNAKKGLDSPQWRVNQYEKIANNLEARREVWKQRGLSTDYLDRKIKRIDGKVSGLKGAITEAVKQAGKERIEEIKAGSKASKLQTDAMRQFAVSLGYDTMDVWESNKRNEYENAWGVVSELAKSGEYDNDPVGLANAAKNKITTMDFLSEQEEKGTAVFGTQPKPKASGKKGTGDNWIVSKEERMKDLKKSQQSQKDFFERLSENVGNFDAKTSKNIDKFIENFGDMPDDIYKSSGWKRPR